jgi:hypothetical protein
LFVRRSLRILLPGCLLLLRLPALTAQELKVSSLDGAQGGRVTLEISFDSAGAKVPTALQWEIMIPAGQLSFVDQNPDLGPAAQRAEKSVSCRAQLLRAKDGDKFGSVCILAGGLKPIPNGVVALIRLQISPEARLEPQRVQATGFAVYQDGKEARVRLSFPL